MTCRLTTTLFVLITTIILCANASAEVRPSKVFSDHMVLQQDLPINVFGSADPGEQVTVEFNGQIASVLADDEGRWLAELPAMKADGEIHTLKIEGDANIVELNDVMLGEVWLCSGQSNMGRSVTIQEPIEGVRFLYRDKAVRGGVFPNDYDYGEHVTVGWCECSPEAMAATPKPLDRSGTPTIRNSYGEVAVQFAERLHQELQVPIGVMNIAFAGSTASSWVPEPGLEETYPFDQLIDEPYFNHKPGVMYQTELHPIIPLTIRGVVWYQGEDDGRNQEYDQDLKTMIESWRGLFRQQELPFYMIQIAQTSYAAGMLRVWESEAWVMENVPYTGLAPSNDLQDASLRIDEGALRQPASGFPIVSGSNPHPPNKHFVAQRAADIALAKTYGLIDREVFGPMYDSHVVENGKVVIKFKHVGDGLITDDGNPPNWFQCATPLSRESYHPSELHYMLRLRQQMVSIEAEIVGCDKIVVYLPEGMEEAFWIGFAWNALSRHNLRNSEALSAIPFRIWDGVPPAPPQ
jgi:sialate O-acetylesterase